MKMIFRNMIFIAAVLLVLAGCSSSKKTVKLDSSQVEQLVNNQSFTFIANRMIPMRGTQKTLTSRYDVTIDTGHLTSFLPYFGRVYGGIMDPTKSPLSFKSSDFTYTVSAKPDGKSWQVNIVPKDYTSVHAMQFTIFDNASANLNITNLNGDPITFYGYLQPNS